jgi:hypothetical protein
MAGAVNERRNVMRQIQIIAASILVLLASSVARGAVGTPIPLSVPSATVYIGMNGVTPPPPEIGPLPLTVPYSGVAGCDCVYSGNVTVSIVSGALQVRQEGTHQGTCCHFQVQVEAMTVVLDVPQVGQNATPILLSNQPIAVSGSVAAEEVEFRVSKNEFSSDLTSGSILEVGFGLRQGLEIEHCVSCQATTSGVSVLDSSSRLLHMLPGDTVTWDGWTYFIDVPGSGTFDMTYQLGAALPSGSVSAAVPEPIGWILAGVLIGLGIKVLRRPARAVAGAGG